VTWYIFYLWSHILTKHLIPDPQFSFDSDPKKVTVMPISKLKFWSLIPKIRWFPIPYFMSNPDPWCQKIRWSLILYIMSNFDPWCQKYADPWSHISCQILIPDPQNTLISDPIFHFKFWSLITKNTLIPDPIFHVKSWSLMPKICWSHIPCNDPYIAWNWLLTLIGHVISPKSSSDEKVRSRNKTKML